MSALKGFILAGAIGLAATGASAATQPGGPPAAPPTAATPPGPTTKPPGWETHQGVGPYHMGPGRGAPAGRMGWSLMTPAERKAHQAKIASMKTYGECHAYVQQHHQQMAERAKARGVAIPAEPRNDPCAQLPK